MKRYKLIYSLILVLVIGTTPLYGQQNAVDSLTGLLSPSLTEPQKAELLIQLTRANRYVDINAAVKAGYEAHELAQTLGSEDLEVQAIRELVTSLIGKREWDDALSLLDRELHLADRRKIIRASLAAFLLRLDRPAFFRTHKSYAVNLD